MCAGRAVNSSLTMRSRFNVTLAQYGYTPVEVPSYLRRKVVQNDIVFIIMGTIGAIFALLQGGYGAYYVWLTSGTMTKLDPDAAEDDADADSGA